MVRPLSKELQKIAAEELNEDPGRVEDDIKHIQEWIKQQPHLNAPTDKQWILGFLRGCKFSLQKAKNKIDMYYSMKTAIPKLATPRDVHSIEIQTALKGGLILPIPSSKNYVGPTVVLFRLNNYDKNIMHLEEMTAFLGMILNTLITEDDNLMVSGIIFWMDMIHLPLNMLFQLTPTYLKAMVTSLEEAMPIRVKLFLGTGSHTLAQKLFNIVKGYIGPKLTSRVTFTMLRPLSSELQQLAIEELNEDPERVEADIKHIQEWIMQQPHLNAPTDKQWILGFLRGCKFSLEKTKRKFDMYYTYKTTFPELANPRDVSSIEIQAMLKAGLVIPLPSSKNYAGPTVVLGRFNNYDKNIMNLEDMTTFIGMILNILIVEDDNLMVSGLVFWIDMEHFPLNLFFQLTPNYLRATCSSLEKAFPMRVKLVLGTGSPALAQRLFYLMKEYVGPKLSSRVLLYNADEFKNILKIIPRSHIPKEYGGDNSTLQDITDYWKEKVESYSSWFTKTLPYGTNEALRPEQPAALDDIIGIDGSFRKLNID